jgi:chemotaxis regulatin CheY-phosphate phosphatase CheZ
MATNLSLSNVEELVFSNKRVVASLPQYKSLFDSWLLSKRVSHLRNLGHRAILDFLESVSEDEVEIISIVNNIYLHYQKISFKRYKNLNSKINEVEKDLLNVSNFIDMCVYRKKDEVRVFLWK